VGGVEPYKMNGRGDVLTVSHGINIYESKNKDRYHGISWNLMEEKTEVYCSSSMAVSRMNIYKWKKASFEVNRKNVSNRYTKHTRRFSEAYVRGKLFLRKSIWSNI